MESKKIEITERKMKNGILYETSGKIFGVPYEADFSKFDLTVRINISGTWVKDKTRIDLEEQTFIKKHFKEEITKENVKEKIKSMMKTYLEFSNFRKH
jgi:hypothetical protein